MTDYLSDSISTLVNCFICTAKQSFIGYSVYSVCFVYTSTFLSNRTLYTTLPHNLIKNKLTDLIERTFQRNGSPYLACNDRNAFLLRENLQNIMHSRVKMYVMR